MWNQILFSLIFCVIIYLFWKIIDRSYNKQNWIKFYSNYFLYFLFCFISSALTLPVCFVRPMNLSNGKLFSKTTCFFTNLFLQDVQYHIRDGYILTKDRAAIIIANHQSIFDVLGIMNTWRYLSNLIVVTRKEVFYLWPFGLMAYLSGMVFIDRNDSSSAYKQLKDLSNLMVQNKMKLWIFPEGTRNRSGSHIFKFRKGAFNTAVAAQVPIIPIVFSPYYFINKKKCIFSKGKIIMQCLKPIPTAGLSMDDVPELVDCLQQIMSETYKNLSVDVHVSKSIN